MATTKSTSTASTSTSSKKSSAPKLPSSVLLPVSGSLKLSREDAENVVEDFFYHSTSLDRSVDDKWAKVGDYFRVADETAAFIRLLRKSGFVYTIATSLLQQVLALSKTDGVLAVINMLDRNQSFGDFVRSRRPSGGPATSFTAPKEFHHVLDRLLDSFAAKVEELEKAEAKYEAEYLANQQKRKEQEKADAVKNAQKLLKAAGFVVTKK